MDSSTNNTMQNINELDLLLDSQTIRTRFDFNESWDQFWNEYNMLNSTITNDMDDGWWMEHTNQSKFRFGNGTRTLRSLARPAIIRSLRVCFDWPLRVPNIDSSPILTPDYMDDSLALSWADPSTSDFSPSATSVQSTFTSPNSTPSQGYSSTQKYYTCNFCAQTFAKKSFLK